MFPEPLRAVIILFDTMDLSHQEIAESLGISVENVVDGIRHVRPAGVDSCTLTNALDSGGKPIRFKKDLAKVKQFVQAARSAEKEIGNGQT